MASCLERLPRVSLTEQNRKTRKQKLILSLLYHIPYPCSLKKKKKKAIPTGENNLMQELYDFMKLKLKRLFFLGSNMCSRWRYI